MNCLSINVRGLGGDNKAVWINRLKSVLGVSFIGLQETMSCNVDDGVVSRLWGGLGLEFEKVDSVGNSGGLLSMWDPKFLRKDRVLKGDNFLCVSGLLSDGLMRLNMVNVYAP